MRNELPDAVEAALCQVLDRQRANPSTPLSCSTHGSDVQAFCMLVVECHKASCRDEGWVFEGEMLAQHCETAGIDRVLRAALASDFDVGINVLDVERSGSVYSRPPWTVES